MTEELFYKYTNNQCTTEEKNITEEWLETCTDEELAVLLNGKWEASYDEMPHTICTDIWDFIYQKIKPDNIVKMTIRKKDTFYNKKALLAAVCIIFLLLTGYPVFLIKDKAVLQTNQKANRSKPIYTEWVTVKNSRKHSQIILLKDNSKIELFPHSTICYASDFNYTARNIYLSGRAIFSVAKDKTKPFTVFCDEIATTAIGTRFQVNGNLSAGVISVKLFEGILKIQSTRRIIKGWENGKLLYSGEEVRFENEKAITRLNTEHAKQKIIHEKNSVNQSLGDEIIFSNTPLSEVFEKMEKLYSIKIVYDKKDVAGMLFTTTINRKDLPSSILNAIVQMNSLRFQTTDNVYIITRVRDNKQ